MRLSTKQFLRLKFLYEQYGLPLSDLWDLTIDPAIETEPTGELDGSITFWPDGVGQGLKLVVLRDGSSHS